MLSHWKLSLQDVFWCAVVVHSADKLNGSGFCTCHEMHIFLQVKLLVGIQPIFRSTLPVQDLLR